MVQTAAPVPINHSRSVRPLLSSEWDRLPRVETRLDRALTRSFISCGPSTPPGSMPTSTALVPRRNCRMNVASIILEREP